jgi:amidase
VDPFPDAIGLARLIRSRELSPVEVMEETLRRVDEVNPALNAIIWRSDEEARASARTAAVLVVSESVDDLPPFLGVPLPIKDMTAAAGQPLTYGSYAASDEAMTEDELVVAALRRAGFVLTGRTNVPEFGPISTTENDRYGITRNPWQTEYTPGGSSGGAAAAVASGMFSIAHANDGGGSIRMPASCCGLVGLKPSRGRVPSLVKTWEGAVSQGVLTHTVADTATVLDLISGFDQASWYNAPPPSRPFRDEVGVAPAQLRIGLVDSPPMGLPVAESCLEAVHGAGRLLESLGHSVDRVELDFDFDRLAAAQVLVDGQYTQPIGDWSKAEPQNRIGHERGRRRDSIAYVEAVEVLQRWSRDFIAPWGRDFDVLVTPTMAIEPPPAGQQLAELKARPDSSPASVFPMGVFCFPFNMCGLPAISLPLHQARSGLPIGVQLVGRPFDEAGLIRLAAQIETAAPWLGRHPDN